MNPNNVRAEKIRDTDRWNRFVDSFFGGLPLHHLDFLTLLTSDDTGGAPSPGIAEYKAQWGTFEIPYYHIRSITMPLYHVIEKMRTIYGRAVARCPKPGFRRYFEAVARPFLAATIQKRLNS